MRCGANKRADFFGIDIAPGPAVDLVLDIEHQPLPFPDDSVDHVYTSHAFEHLTNYQYVLREIMRIADSLDRSHHQPVQKLVLASRGRTVWIKVKSRQAVDLELWDVEHEVALFREVFGRALVVTAER